MALLGILFLAVLVCGLGWRLTAQGRARDREVHEAALRARDEVTKELVEERDRLRRLADARAADVARLEAELARCTVPGVVRERLTRTLGGDEP